MDKLQSFFISASNAARMIFQKKVRADDAMILLPRCLQHNECKQNVVEAVKNCKRCGRCPIGDIAGSAEQFGVKVFLATGTLMARDYIKEYKPKLIIAVACERELFQGMCAVFPRPVIALVNVRPHGPCKNTQVDLSRLEQIMNRYIEK